MKENGFLKLASFTGVGVILSSAWLSFSAAASFTDIGAGLSGVSGGAAAWGDYDNDGDLDLVINGYAQFGQIARIYRNTGGVFADAGVIPAGDAVYGGAVAWGDYDRDGDLDLAMSGYTGTIRYTRVYRNTAGAFTDQALGLEGVENGALGWGDYDNDGDLDLAVIGHNGAVLVAHLYRNDGATFTNVASALPALDRAALAWGDYDNDGDQDLVASGQTDFLNQFTQLYRNDAGVLTLVSAGLPGASLGSLAWGDYDNDGDLDLLICGFNNNGPIGRIYRNTAGSFADIGAGLEQVEDGAAMWGDYDNDGDLDVAMAGQTGSIGISNIYRNTAGAFSNVENFDIAYAAELAWGDYDNDRDLDLVLSGADFSAPYTRIYRNDVTLANTAPTAPTGLSVTYDATKVTFQWNASTDTQTPAAGLSYNLWVGSAPASGNIMPGMSNLSTGYRRIAAVGNVGQNLDWALPRSLIFGHNTYWGVQAVDGAFVGSPFANGAVLTLDASDPPGSLGFGLALEGANPFRTEASFGFTLPRGAQVDLSVFDAAGRRVCELVEGFRSAGRHMARWDGRDVRGHSLSAGLYFVRLRGDQDAAWVKVLKVE